jgi:hypothetical protein
VSNYSVSFTGHVSKLSGNVAAGDVLCRVNGGSYVLADAATVAAGGIPVAVALTAGSSSSQIQIQHIGEVDASVVTLPIGARAYAAVGSTGRLERLTAPPAGSVVYSIGLVDAYGNVSLGPPKRWAISAPTSGSWIAGDTVEHVTPTAGGNVGWVCVTGGSPGTWKTYGAIGS